MATNSTLPYLANDRTVSLPPDGIFEKVLVLFTIFVSSFFIPILAQQFLT